MYDYPENDYRSYLQHSSKGTKWKDHKYIAIKNGRYIYPSKSGAGTNAKGGWEKWRILKDTENKVQPIYDRDEEIVSKSKEKDRQYEANRKALKEEKDKKKKTGEYAKDSISKKIREDKKLKNRVRRILGLAISKIRRK